MSKEKNNQHQAEKNSTLSSQQKTIRLHDIHEAIRRIQAGEHPRPQRSQRSAQRPSWINGAEFDEEEKNLYEEGMFVAKSRHEQNLEENSAGKQKMLSDATWKRPRFGTSSQSANPASSRKKSSFSVFSRMRNASSRTRAESTATSGASLPQEKEKRTLWQIAQEWIVYALIAMVLALCVRAFVGGVTTVQGQSMYPTLENGDVLVVNKLVSYTGHYHRADIIIFHPPDASNDLYVKRIIGMPGETVRLENQKIYINDQWLREFYLDEPPTDPYGQVEWQLGEDEYFVLGDNREPGRSNDSRVFGPISASSIIGVAVFRLWPLKHIGGL